MESVLTFLWGYHDDGNEFPDWIITGDETWVAHTTPEMKQQSMSQWMFLKDSIQADFVGMESDVQSIMGQMGYSLH